jgi:GMP synthase-like glutamine amidotransferase
MILIIVPIKETFHCFLNNLLLINSIQKTKTKLICTLDDLDNIKLEKITGIIIVGSSLSLIKDNKIDETYQKIIAPLILLNVPVLGICYGHEILNLLLGGTIKKMTHEENIIKNIFIKKKM